VNAILIRVCFHVGTRAEECWPAQILMCVFVACVSSKVDMSLIRTPTFGVYCTSEEAKSPVRNGSGLVHRIYMCVCVCVCVNICIKFIPLMQHAGECFWLSQIVLIDLILHKPEAYRHTFFNYPLRHKLNMLVLDLVLASCYWLVLMTNFNCW
jgi:hypothetical protein